MGLQLCLLYIPLYSRHFCQYRGVMSTLTKQLFRSIKVMNPICRWLIMLTRGPNSTQPCPICCVPEEYLDAIDLSFNVVIQLHAETFMKRHYLLKQRQRQIVFAK